MNWVKNNIANYIYKFTVITVFTGFLIGSFTALFLVSLELVTQYRDGHEWIIYGLPVMGIFIGWLYYKFGIVAKKGNNLIIEQHQGSQKQSIPLIMMPLVFITTILTHLSGGSAGREGTAVQMGGAIADSFTKICKLSDDERSTVLIMGVSAGFAAVFGTPFAGAVFALEIMLFKNCKWADVIPSIGVAFLAHYTCIFWGIQHTQYTINNIPAIQIDLIFWAILAGGLFGLAANLFTRMQKIFSKQFNKVHIEILRPFIGGIIIIIALQFLGTTKHIGLGIPTIIESFYQPVGNFDFIIKILLTALTLSAGFKGGEVTPLFFIGATLGNILIWFIPLPMALLAGMGFVAVFAGATNTAITGILLGIEMFGLSAGVFVGIASIVAYFTSGMEGIYSTQLKEGLKYKLYHIINSTIKR